MVNTFPTFEYPQLLKCLQEKKVEEGKKNENIKKNFKDQKNFKSLHFKRLLILKQQNGHIKQCMSLQFPNTFPRHFFFKCPNTFCKSKAQNCLP